mmetsp:Transcript_17703/g.26215  ORF Transcript_17703/g.26215 Transcript_17703/m.26215 type:complete len:244 (-) Transcript_17703:68-799(-)
MGMGVKRYQSWARKREPVYKVDDVSVCAVSSLKRNESLTSNGSFPNLTRAESLRSTGSNVSAPSLARTVSFSTASSLSSLFNVPFDEVNEQNDQLVERPKKKVHWENKIDEDAQYPSRTRDSPLVLQQGADKIKEFDDYYRVSERMNESVRSTKEVMKKWEDEWGVAANFNRQMENNSKSLQAWNEKNGFLKAASDTIEGFQDTVDRMCMRTCMMTDCMMCVEPEFLAMEDFDELFTCPGMKA